MNDKISTHQVLNKPETSGIYKYNSKMQKVTTWCILILNNFKLNGHVTVPQYKPPQHWCTCSVLEAEHTGHRVNCYGDCMAYCSQMGQEGTVMKTEVAFTKVRLTQIWMRDRIRYPQTVIYRFITQLLNLIRFSFKWHYQDSAKRVGWVLTMSFGLGGRGSSLTKGLQIMCKIICFQAFLHLWII